MTFIWQDDQFLFGLFSGDHIELLNGLNIACSSDACYYAKRQL
jgi:hypothetical protein